TARTGRACVSGDLRNLPGAATQSRCRPDLVAADSDCRFACANGGEPSRGKAFTESQSRIHYQWNHNAGADRIGNSARARAAFAPGDAAAVAALGRITLADECDRLRALVLP